jgi:hypothetical protein
VVSSFRFSNKNCTHISDLLMRSTCPAHITIFYYQHDYDTQKVDMYICYMYINRWINTWKKEPGSSGSIVPGYGLDDRAIGVRSPVGANDFSSILCVQTGSGAHPASCIMGTGGPFAGGKSAAGAWRWPLTPI